MKFLLASQNFPFAIALGLMAALTLCELLALVAGLSLLDDGIVDKFFPQESIESPELEGAGAFSRLLSWLRVGQMPLLILLIVFLTWFGIIGLGLQALAQAFFGSMLHSLPASGAALALSLPIVRGSGGILKNILPKDESSALSQAQFIGRMAVITGAPARKGTPTEAKFQDEFGQTHYLLVEPDIEDEAFATGSTVLLVKQEGGLFKAITPVNETLKH